MIQDRLEVPHVAGGIPSVPIPALWTRDTKGHPADPVTLLVHGPLPELEADFEKEGWTEADPNSLSSDVHYLKAAFHQEVDNTFAAIGRKVDGFEDKLHLPLPRLGTTAPQIPGVQRMPLSPQSLDGKPSVIEFEKNNNPLGGRDHMRVYDTGEQDAAGEPVEAIAASHDSGIHFAPNHPETGFIFHSVTPDVNPERDLVKSSLLSEGATATPFTETYGQPSIYNEQVPDSTGYDVTLSS